jgi:large subunit ribosomal protein L21
MYAIARIAGKQFRIEPDLKVKVPTLPLEVGAAYQISEILLTCDGEKTIVGAPLVEGASAAAKVIKHSRDPKVMVLHKKRRKGYVKLAGHRQGYTWIQIEKIEGLASKPARRKKADKAAPAEGE